MSSHQLIEYMRGEMAAIFAARFTVNVYVKLAIQENSICLQRTSCGGTENESVKTDSHGGNLNCSQNLPM